MGERWIELLKRTGAMQEGHFLLSSGRHSGRYVQCARALEHPADAEALGRALGDEIEAAVDGAIDCVVSPPLGGILIGYEVARRLGGPFLFPERDEDGVFRLRRGFSLESGARVCVIEDVITTGRTTREVLDLVRRSGAEPVALGAIIDRSPEHAVDGIPLLSVLRLEIPTNAADNCPLCADGPPLVKPGSRREPTGPSGGVR